MEAGSVTVVDAGGVACAGVVVAVSFGVAVGDCVAVGCGAGAWTGVWIGAAAGIFCACCAAEGGCTRCDSANQIPAPAKTRTAMPSGSAK